MNFPADIDRHPCIAVIWRATVLSMLSLALVFPPLASGQTKAGQAEGESESRDDLFAKLAADVDALQRQGNIVKRVVQLVRPTVVHIEAKHQEGNERYARRTVEEAGSGIIIESGGKHYVLTNRHVIKGSGAESIKIKLADGRSIYPRKIWEDPETDVACLAVEVKGLIPARLGDSRHVEIGDFVLAVGSPFGLSHSVSYGIISAKGRRDLELGDDGVRYQDFLQTDAAINPGNSGGPLLNLRGEVIGINTAIASASGGHEGIGFSIPINMAMAVVKQLLEKGTVTHAYLGVKLDSRFDADQAIRAGLPRGEGARVNAITPKSPAEVAKLKVGDVILSFDDVAIDDDTHLINLVSLTPVGTEVELRVLRGAEILEVKVKVGNRAEIE
ncbi:MAG TPA: trypsin-like peptidase domain-containing protein [Pirellulaceae bacterium]|nr:trypsin-like peptidase domain-containing protein [Pirellulaceae bacterium]